MKTALICIGIALPILVIAVLAACRRIYSVAFQSPHRHQNDPLYIPKGFYPGADNETFLGWVKSMDEVPCEKVSITSRDGLSLTGRYYHTADNAPVALCLHGYRSHPMKDFCGGGKLFPRMGYNVLMVHHRAHCESEGKAITFGIKERYDCIEWVKYISARFGSDTPVFIYGISMGAATAILASGEKDLPVNVKCVIADCPYSSPRDIIRKVSGDMGFPVGLAYPFVCLSAILYGRFRIGKVSCVEAAKNSRVPILLIHGEKDDFVPQYMSDLIAKDNPKVEYHTFAGASHGISYITDKERYINIVKEFLDKNMGVD